MTVDQKAITSALSNYASALKEGDSVAIAALYTDDGVLLAPEMPTAVGAAAVRQVYAGLCRDINFDITFHIAEVVGLAPEWAFARTTSTGTVRINATGATVPEANQELFIFNKVAGAWRIARYAFSVVNPPPKQ